MTQYNQCGNFDPAIDYLRGCSVTLLPGNPDGWWNDTFISCANDTFPGYTNRSCLSTLLNSNMNINLIDIANLGLTGFIDPDYAVTRILGNNVATRLNSGPDIYHWAIQKNIGLDTLPGLPFPTYLLTDCAGRFCNIGSYTDIPIVTGGSDSVGLSNSTIQIGLLLAKTVGSIAIGGGIIEPLNGIYYNGLLYINVLQAQWPPRIGSITTGKYIVRSKFQLHDRANHISRVIDTYVTSSIISYPVCRPTLSISSILSTYPYSNVRINFIWPNV